MIVHNVLFALDLQFGKVRWQSGKFSVNSEIDDPFWTGHFLGVPCSSKDRLYVLHETEKGDLRLVALDPTEGAREAALSLDQLEGPDAFLLNQQRRLNPAQVIVANGLLVCVPYTGKVFGVGHPKLETRWTYTYRQKPPAQGDKEPLGKWKAPAAFIQNGKLVFTAADDDHLHCINVEDGKLLWKVKRADDLYLAGIAGDKVLLVGTAACRALALKDGSELWKLSTGLPAGIGAFDKKTYLLPLRFGAVSKKPEIAYLDVEQGRVSGTSPLPETPGNLLLQDGFIVSQSVTAIAAYAREKAK
jgi:outer membrane protein assembly factor BamB